MAASTRGSDGSAEARHEAAIQPSNGARGRSVREGPGLPPGDRAAGAAFPIYYTGRQHPMTDATSISGHTSVPPRELRRRAIAGLSLVLVLAAGIAALFIVQGVDSQMRDVQHTYEVRRQARELVQALVDAETGQRGYLLTSEQAYLEPYRAAVSALDAIYRNLLELTGDNPAQKAKLSALAESIEQKRSEMATTITLATGGRLAEAQSIIRSNAGLALMERIRGTLTDFIAEEDAKLIERNARVDASRVWLVAT